MTTPAGSSMAGLLAIFAEFEREILRERTRVDPDATNRTPVREIRCLTSFCSRSP